MIWLVNDKIWVYILDNTQITSTNLENWENCDNIIDKIWDNIINNNWDQVVNTSWDNVIEKS